MHFARPQQQAIAGCGAGYHGKDLLRPIGANAAVAHVDTAGALDVSAMLDQGKIEAVRGRSGSRFAGVGGGDGCASDALGVGSGWRTGGKRRIRPQKSPRASTFGGRKRMGAHPL